MLLCRNKYLVSSLQKIVLGFVMLLAFTINTTAQNYDLKTKPDNTSLNPLLFAAFKKPVKPTPILAERMKPSKYELMYWPNFPLTAAQMEARDREWERRNSKTLGGQIVSDIVDSYVNSLLSGKKTPVAVRPKF